MKDEKEKIRKFLNMQYVKMKRMATVGSLILLALNLSFTIYPYVEFRFPEQIFEIIPRTYLAIPIIFLIIVFLIWFCAHIYMSKMEMYRTESLADRILNPYAVYAIGPFEEMLYRTMTIPTLEASYMAMPEGKEKEEVKKNLEQAKKFVDLGYIPKEDFPKHLKKYYITNKERRL
jgi:hypothetical protein